MKTNQINSNHAATTTPDAKTAAAQLISNLSPEKQALLAKRLKEKRALKQKFLNTKQVVLESPIPLIPMLIIDYVHRPPQAWWRLVERLVEIPRILSPALIAEAVQQLIVHHDALRLRLVVKEKDDYAMFIAASENEAFQERDLSYLTASEQDDAIEAAKEMLWASLNLSTGPLFLIVFFNLGQQRLPRLFIIMHHFAVDAYSVGLLLKDFQTACTQLMMGQPVQLPAKTTSMKEWAERMHAYVHSDSVRTEVDYWKSLPWADVHTTPVDHPEVHESPSGYLTDSLNLEETQALLSKVPAAYHVRLWDILLTACAVTYARYAQRHPILMWVLHHGRNPLFDKFDLLHTVGSLYIAYPLLLDVDTDQFPENPEKVLKSVAEQRGRVPNGGTAWYWMSYYTHEKFISLEENVKIVPNVVFNYLGEIKSVTPTTPELFREVQNPDSDITPHSYDLTAKSPYSCKIMIEAGQLKVTWEYFSALSEQATIEHLVQEYLSILRSLIRMAGEEDA